MVDGEDELTLAGVQEVDQVVEDALVALLLLVQLHLAEGAVGQEGGRGAGIPTDGEDFGMFVVADQVLPELSFVLVLLQKASDADDHVLALDVWFADAIELADSGLLKTLVQIHLLGVFI